MKPMPALPQRYPRSALAASRYAAGRSASADSRQPRWPAIGWLACLWAGLALCVSAALAFGAAAPRAVVDAELIGIIRAMALIKGGLALAAASALSWWLRQGARAPAGGLTLAACVGGVWAMGGASALGWQLSAWARPQPSSTPASSPC